MAFDTNVAAPSPVALEIRPPQVQSPLEAAAQFQQLRAGQQQSQAVAMENQQRALDLQDQQVARQAYMQSGGDMNKFQQLLMQGGASPKMVTQIQQQILGTKKTLGEVAETQLKNDQARHDQARGELTSFDALPDPQKAAQYPQVMQGLRQRGLLNDQEFNEWMQQNPTYPGSDAMKMGINHLATGSQLAKEEIERRNAASAETTAASRQATADTSAQRLTAELPGIQAGNTQKQQEVSGTKPIQPAEQARIDFERLKEGREASQGAQRIGIERQNSARMQKQFDATYGAMLDGNGKPLEPEAAKAVASQDPMAVAVANYQLPPPTISRSGPGAATLRKVMAINPDYDAKDWQNRSNTLKEFSSSATGKAGGQIVALNTLVHHADLFQQVGEAMKNGSFRPGNAAYNAVSTMMGSPAPTNAALVSRFLAGETAKVATGGVPAEGELNGILSKLSTDSSPDQLVNAGKTLLGIAAGRMTPLKEKADAAHIGNLVQIIGPDARQILQRRGFDPNTMKPAAAATAAPAGKIAVISPEGTPGFIDADKWDAAQKRGFKKQ